MVRRGLADLPALHPLGDVAGAQAEHERAEEAGLDVGAKDVDGVVGDEAEDEAGGEAGLGGDGVGDVGGEDRDHHREAGLADDREVGHDRAVGDHARVGGGGTEQRDGVEDAAGDDQRDHERDATQEVALDVLPERGRLDGFRHSFSFRSLLGLLVCLDEGDGRVDDLLGVRDGLVDVCVEHERVLKALGALDDDAPRRG